MPNPKRDGEKKPIHTETLRHKEAFEYYYSLGDSRSLEKVGKKFRVSSESAEKWSRSFDWSKRVIERDDKVGAKMHAKAESDIVEIKSRQMKLMRIIHADYVNKVKAGTAITTASAAINAAEHEMFLAGGPTQSTVAAQAIASAVAFVVAALRREIPDACPNCRSSLEIKLKVSKALEDLSARIDAEPLR